MQQGHSRVLTLNEMGTMTTDIGEMVEKFLGIACRQGATVLEIGSAYGPVCIEALRRGSGNYTVIEIEQRHLEILESNVAKSFPSKLGALRLITGAFPSPETVDNLKDCSFDAILAANVLHFLTRYEMKEAFHQLRRLLIPGGKLIAYMSTLYIGIVPKVFMSEVSRDVDAFLVAVSSGKDVEELLLPGFIGETRKMAAEASISKDVMDEIGLPSGHSFAFDVRIVKYLLDREKFEIETCEYVPVLREPWKFDGRERLNVIASKLRY